MNKPIFGKERRQNKIRAKIKKVSDRPRLTVFRSNKFIYAQIIDDKKGMTLLATNEKELITNKKIVNTETRKKHGNTKDSVVQEKFSDSVLPGKHSKLDNARELGKLLAQKAQKIKIVKVVFDKGPYLYHGRVKALAEGAREGGLEF